MATWVGHGLAGAAVARAAGASDRTTMLAGVAANAPDLDLLLGLGLRGDSGAFHRVWWSHSPVVAVYAFAVVLGWFAVRAAWERRVMDRRAALGAALLAAVVMLTHPLLDYVLVNPAVALPSPDAGLSFDAAARQLFALVTDALFYGALLLALLWRRRGPWRSRRMGW